MVRLINSEDLIRIILIFSGTALILIGFYGIIEDFIHNWRIEEYSSLAALLSGAAILLATTVVYVILPEYQSRRRIDMLKQYYTGKPMGEIKDLQHNIIERSQGIIGSAEILAECVHQCSRDDVSHEECKTNIIQARKMLENVDIESNRLREFLNRLDDYTGSKQQ